MVLSIGNHKPIIYFTVSKTSLSFRILLLVIKNITLFFCIHKNLDFRPRLNIHTFRRFYAENTLDVLFSDITTSCTVYRPQLRTVINIEHLDLVSANFSFVG